VRDLRRRGADGVRRRRLGLAMLGEDEAPVVGILLHALDDAVHHRDGLQRILARGGFRRQHHSIGAVIDGGGDV
jgi:hypothetical protein